MTSLLLHATPTDWQITPSTCISNKSGEPCHVEITVSLPHSLSKETQPLPQNNSLAKALSKEQMDQVCFYINDQVLKCISSQTIVAKIPVAISQTSTLKIRINDKLVAEKQLVFQSLTPNNKRRRVRNPWSIF